MVELIWANRPAPSGMPKEVTSKDEFLKLLETAEEVRVVREGENAKVKARTKDSLYTFKTTAEDADSIIKGLKIDIVEY